MTSPPSIGVVGAGIVGLSTAFALLEQGADVTVYDRGAPGAGQSGGESRIFRHAHADPRLVAFARDSRAVWREWEAHLGTELVSSDGAVAIGEGIEDKLSTLSEVEGTRARRITPAELAELVPILSDYDGPAMVDEDGGSIRTTAAIDGLVAALGERLVADEVLTLRPTGAGVEVLAGGIRAGHDRVVVCAGRRTPALARGLGLSLPVEQAAHVRLTFALRDGAPDRLATLQDGSGEYGETGTYAAALPGNTHYAVGLSQTTEARDDASLPHPDGLADLADRARAYVGRALPGLDPDPVDVRHCWVTRLPWGDDGVAVWEAEGVLLLAGHNLFKQAPGLGRALAAAAVGDGLPDILQPDAQLGRDG
jgi:sarcosine oxidase